MNVGGLCLDGTGDEFVHQADDRRLACHVLEAAHIVLAGLLGRSWTGIGCCRCATAVKSLERPLDVACGHDAVCNGAPEQVPDGGHGIRVEGVRRGQQDGVARFDNRNDAVVHQELELKPIGKQRELGQVLRLDQRQAQKIGQEPGEFGFGDQSEPGQDQIEAFSGLPLGPLGPVERQVIEDAALG